MAVKTSWSERVRLVATTAIHEAGSPAKPHPTAAITVDGVTLSDPTDIGTHLLLLAQATAANNGPWIYQGIGADMIRPDDFGTVTNPTSGVTVTAGPEGMTLAGTTWRLITPDPITVNSTSLNFSLAQTNAGADFSTGNMPVLTQPAAQFTGINHKASVANPVATGSWSIAQRIDHTSTGGGSWDGVMAGGASSGYATMVINHVGGARGGHYGFGIGMRATGAGRRRALQRRRRRLGRLVESKRRFGP